MDMMYDSQVRGMGIRSNKNEMRGSFWCSLREGVFKGQGRK